MFDRDSKIAGDSYAARQDFHRIVWPRIASCFKPGKLVQVESIFMDDPVDTQSGIDWWHVLRDGTKRGMAVRVQWMAAGSQPWDSFTIRESREWSGTEWTELAKRRKAIAQDLVRPQFVIHAYISNQRFLSAGIMEADVLYRDVIDAHGDEIKTGRRVNMQGRGNATFLPVWWSDLREWGYKIRIVEDA